MRAASAAPAEGGPMNQDEGEHTMAGGADGARLGIESVDRNGQQWYRLTLDGSGAAAGTPAGVAVGPAFRAEELGDAIAAVLSAYLAMRDRRAPGHERLADTLRRVGPEPFRAAAAAAATAAAAAADAVRARRAPSRPAEAAAAAGVPAQAMSALPACCA